MNLDFTPILKDLGPDFGFRIANEAKMPDRYAFNRILPERTLPRYDVKSGSMTIRPTMAGLVGMDSPYPPGGNISVSKFLEETAKIANSIPLTEVALRDLQAFLQGLTGNATASKELLAQTVLNFTRKVVVQAHYDTMEYLRGQALLFGEIDWTFNGIALTVDYGVPAGNLFATRTGTSAYGGSASTFWADHRAARKLLKHNVQEILMHADTWDEILGNDVNKIQVISETGSQFRIRRLIGTNERESTDARDTLTISLYSDYGAVLDPADTKKTIDVDFLPPGKILYVGRNNDNGFRIGEGPTEDPDAARALGYTHIGPTVEGGTPGRWARTFTPQTKPWMLVGEGVTNGLPVIDAPKKIVVLSTDLA